eukprot:9428678-Pyramimonas_sp.AAC.1
MLMMMMTNMIMMMIAAIALAIATAIIMTNRCVLSCLRMSVELSETSQNPVQTVKTLSNSSNRNGA